MTVGRFFDRVVTAVGRHLTVERGALETRLDRAIPGVECSPAGTAGAWTDELLTNLLARLYPRLVIVGDASTAERCRALARAIHPSIDLIDEPSRATLLASTVASVGATDRLVVGSRGWMAYLGGSPPPSSTAEPNVFAAGTAAALAARAIFRHLVLSISSVEPPIRWNLLSHRHADPDDAVPTSDVDLGKVLVAGIGAVGNAALWCLTRQARLTGELLLLDPEPVDLSNLQRYVLASDRDVGLSKTDLAARELTGSGLRPTILHGRLGETVLDEDIDRILVTVDNVEGRRIAQSLLPRLVVNGWTSDDGLGASWHDFALGRACLACVYHPDAPRLSEIEIVAAQVGLTPARAGQLIVNGGPLEPGDLRVVEAHLKRPLGSLEVWSGKRLRECHQVVVCGAQAAALDRDEHEEVVVPLAHQSVLAGVLAAAELVKRSCPALSALSQRENAVTWDDLTRPPPGARCRPLASRRGCICRDQDYHAVHRARWATRSTPEQRVARSNGELDEQEQVRRADPRAGGYRPRTSES